MSLRSRLLTAGLLISAGGGAVLCWAWQQAVIREASGVTRVGDWLLVADDSEVGAYYKIAVTRTLGPVFELNALRPQRVLLRHRGLGVDIESIGMLADGRIALLSERLRSLVCDDGIIAEYDSELAEMGKRGLEGLAIRPLANGASRVAVVWEGGYPDFGALPRRAAGQNAWLPLVLIHDVARNARSGRIRLRDALAAIELNVPRPPGNEPAAQRFRVPDLVWTKLPAGSAKGDGWGFIALLSSQNGLANPTFVHKWLLRFDTDGTPIGEALDLANYIPSKIAGANWEGMAWFEPGKKLVLVHEDDVHTPAHGFVMELPVAWQFTPAK